MAEVLDTVEEVVIEPHWSEPFKIAGIPYMHLEIEIEKLSTKVPANAPGAKKNQVFEEDENGNSVEVSFDLKELHEYAPFFWPSVNEGKVILLCRSVDYPNVRQHDFNEKNADQWAYFAHQEWGKEKADFFDHARAEELKFTPEEAA